MKTKFSEIQKFTQWWVWLIMGGLFIIPLTSFLLTGAKKAIVPFLIISGLNLFFYLITLNVKIDNKGIRLVYFPFVNKYKEWSEVKDVSVINYGFVGGWGIRFWTKYGTVYNVRGNKGLLVELNDGKTFVIGTQKEKELKEMLQILGKTE